jgi:hypothetical protein
MPKQCNGCQFLEKHAMCYRAFFDGGAVFARKAVKAVQDDLVPGDGVVLKVMLSASMLSNNTATVVEL